MDKILVTPREIKEICLRVMPTGIAVGVAGKPGTAKSFTGCSLAEEFSKALGEPFKTIMFNCAYHEATDVGGIPYVKDGDAHFAITDLWPKTPNNVIVVEELTKGPKLIQNAIGELIHEGTLRGYKLPENTYFYLSWNNKEDGAGDIGILSHIANRLMILNIRVDPDEFCQYAITQQWNPMVIAYLNQNKHMVFDEKSFSPEGKKYSIDNPSFASPRTWEKAQQVVSLDLPGNLETAALSGLIGIGATREFLSFKELCKEIPDIDVCINSPKTAPLPKNMSSKYALVLSLSYATKEKTLGGIVQYIERMQKEMQVLYLKSLSTMSPEIFRGSKGIDKLVSSVGNLVVG